MLKQNSSSPAPVGSQELSSKIFSISRGVSEQSAQTRRFSLTWEELCERLRQPTIGPKAGSWWSPATFVEDRRRAENVEQVALLLLDVESQDGETQPMPPKHFAGLLDIMGWLACIHTTYSHHPEKPRYRVVVMPDRPLKKEELRPAITALAQQLWGKDYAKVCDLKASGDAARLFYLPRVADDKARELFFFSTTFGQPVCVDDLLQHAPESVAQGGASAPHLHVVGSTPYGEAALQGEVARVLAAQVGERNNTLNEAAFKLGQLVARGELDEHEVRNALVAAAQQVGLSADEAHKTVASGLRGGKNKPREAEILFEPVSPCPLGYKDALRATEEEKRRALALARDILLPEFTPGVEYPIHALGPLAPAAERIAQGIQCSPALAGQTVLAAVALLAQSIHNTETLEAPKPLSLYCLTVAGSGEGKDSADRIALRPITKWQKLQAELYNEQCREKKRKDDQPPRESFRIIGDITLEGLRASFARGLASQGIFSTEAGVLLAGHAMQPEYRIKTAAALCGLWDRGHLSVARVGTGRQERYGVRLSAHLLGQPAAVAEILADPALVGIGFWPRFLLAWPAPIPPRKYRPFQPAQEPAIVQYWERMKELLRHSVLEDLDGLPVLPLADQAKKALAAFFETAEQESRRGAWRKIKTFGLRATELAARVAGVLAVYAGKPEIPVECIEPAIELVRYSLANWRAVLEGDGVNPVARHAFVLYGWLLERTAPTHPRDILRQGPVALRSQHRRDEAMQYLFQHWLLHREGDSLIALLPFVDGEESKVAAK